MSKRHIVGLVLMVVLFASGGLAVNASALTFLLAEWLENGNGITATLLAEVVGEILLSEKVNFLGVVITVSVLCSAVGLGFIGPDGAGVITEVLNLKEETINFTPLTELGLECTDDENCAEPLEWPVNLPGLALLVLMEDGTETFFVDLITDSNFPSGGAYIDCMGSGLTDKCTTTEAAILVESTTEGLNGEVSEAFTLLAGDKLANCEVAGAEAGHDEGLGLLRVSGGSVTVTPSE